MPSVYVETTIPSYLAASPSRDLIVAGQQQITHAWWRTAKERFELFTSEAVLREIRAGDQECASRRLQLLASLPVLAITQEIRVLADSYQAALHLPGKAAADALHIGLAVFYEMDYLVTWNCAHIANGRVFRALVDWNDRQNRFTPILLTPQELLSDEDLQGAVE